jgi:hypothetical protein
MHRLDTALPIHYDSRHIGVNLRNLQVSRESIQ